MLDIVLVSCLLQLLVSCHHIFVVLVHASCLPPGEHDRNGIIFLLFLFMLFVFRPEGTTGMASKSSIHLLRTDWCVTILTDAGTIGISFW